MLCTPRTALFAAAIAAVSSIAPSSHAPGGHPARRGPVRRRARLRQGAAEIRGAGQELLRQADQLRAPSQQRAGAGEGLLRLHEPGHLRRLRHRLPAHMSTFSKAAPFIDAPFLFRDLDHWNKVLDADFSSRSPTRSRRRRRDADRLCRRRRAQHLRQQARAQPRRDEGAEGPRPGAPIWSRTFSAIGMSPTVIAYNEIYNAIQNGVIAAGEMRPPASSR